MATSCVTAATAATASVSNRYNLVALIKLISGAVFLQCTLDSYCLSNRQVFFCGEVSTIQALATVNLQLGCCTVIV